MFRRGISHIEAILSFVLFIGFVFFGLYFFTPSGNTNLIDSTLQYTVNKISSENSVELMSFSIKINKDLIPVGQNTITIEFPSEVTEIPQIYNVRVENYDGDILPATREGERVYIDFQENEFLFIRFSEDFSLVNGASSKPSHDNTFYSIASSNTRKIISEKRILNMNESYYSDYEGLKNEYNIPTQVTFGYLITLSDRQILAPLEIPSGVDVYSTISRKEILSKNGEMIFGEIGVRIW